MRCFPVVEIAKNRLRPIDHPVTANDAIHAGNYSAELMNLHAPFEYLDAAFSKASAVADITASYYGFVLPPEARCFYRFRDSEGRLYQMTRMMFGHVVAAEIQQIITSIVAGHSDYVAENFVNTCGGRNPDIWVDNVRYCGSANMVGRCLDRLRDACDACNVRMNIGNVSSANDFIGFHWTYDASSPTIVLADKTRLKLPQSIPTRAAASELEQLIGRLIYAAQGQQLPLAAHWWLLKWARRFFNKLNRGIIATDDIVDIPASARRSLDAWCTSARQPVVIRRAKLDGSAATLFTDATLDSWGAVLLHERGDITIAGGKFPADIIASQNISACETHAVALALGAFRAKLGAIKSLSLFVDNTSAQYAVIRGNPRSAALVDAVVEIWKRIVDSKIELRVGYVESAANPADEISRGRSLDFKKTKNQTNKTHTTKW